GRRFVAQGRPFEALGPTRTRFAGPGREPSGLLTRLLAGARRMNSDPRKEFRRKCDRLPRACAARPVLVSYTPGRYQPIEPAIPCGPDPPAAARLSVANSPRPPRARADGSEPAHCDNRLRHTGGPSSGPYGT